MLFFSSFFFLIYLISQYDLEAFVKRDLPSSLLISKLNGNHIFQVPISGGGMSKFFEEMERNKIRMRISEWGLSQSSLEDVYLKIIEMNKNLKPFH